VAVVRAPRKGMCKVVIKMPMVDDYRINRLRGA
jgi:hypothetical protein